VCVVTKKLIFIGYFRKCIPYSGLVARDMFYIARGDTSNENSVVKLCPGIGERKSGSNFENK